jgi:hypothetical protein
VPVTAIALPRPADPCFPDLDSRNPNLLHLISFRFAHTRACAALLEHKGAPVMILFASCARARVRTFWMAEHHFQPAGTELIPNLLMMAMRLCGVTKNIKIGCGFNIVPMWHPLRLAEDYAMVDILTGGLVIFGCRSRLPHPGGRDLRRR